MGTIKTLIFYCDEPLVNIDLRVFLCRCCHMCGLLFWKTNDERISVDNVPSSLYWLVADFNDPAVYDFQLAFIVHNLVEEIVKVFLDAHILHQPATNSFYTF